MGYGKVLKEILDEKLFPETLVFQHQQFILSSVGTPPYAMIPLYALPIH